MFYVYVFLWATFIDNTTFCYVPEIWPTHLRSKGSSIAYCSYYAVALATNSPAPLAFATIGYKYYFVFFGLCASAVIYVYFEFPEVSLTWHHHLLCSIPVSNPNSNMCVLTRRMVLLSRRLVRSLVIQCRSISGTSSIMRPQRKSRKSEALQSRSRMPKSRLHLTREVERCYLFCRHTQAMVAPSSFKSALYGRAVTCAVPQ